MPKADPEQWRQLRIEWETSEMSISEVAERLGVAIPTVSIRARKEAWVKSDVIEPKRLNLTPRELVDVAVRALVRAATQTRDMGAAVKAAGMLLDRTMGRVVAEQATPMLPPEEMQQKEQWPDWLNERRLAYQEGKLTIAPPDDEDAQAPEEPQALPEPPARLPASRPRVQTASPEPTEPRLSNVVQFWDRPTLPASGPTRDPDRLN